MDNLLECCFKAALRCLTFVSFRYISEQYYRTELEPTSVVWVLVDFEKQQWFKNLRKLWGKVGLKQRWLRADKSVASLAWGRNWAVTERERKESGGLGGEWFDGQCGQRDRERRKKSGRKKARKPIWLLVRMVWWGGGRRVAGGGSPINPMSSNPGPQVRIANLLVSWVTWFTSGTLPPSAATHTCTAQWKVRKQMMPFDIYGWMGWMGYFTPLGDPYYNTYHSGAEST